MKKFLTIPQDVELVSRVDGSRIQTISFKKFFYECLLADLRWSRSYDESATARTLDKAFQKSGGKPGSIVELDVPTWEKLRDCAKSPSQGYTNFSSLAMMQVLDFVDVIVGASDKEPEGYVPDNGVRATEHEARGQA